MDRVRIVQKVDLAVELHEYQVGEEIAVELPAQSMTAKPTSSYSGMRPRETPEAFEFVEQANTFGVSDSFG
jgi:hypothetical protein